MQRQVRLVVVAWAVKEFFRVFFISDVVRMRLVVLFDVVAGLRDKRASDVPAPPREHELLGAAQEASTAATTAARGLPIAEEFFLRRHCRVHFDAIGWIGWCEPGNTEDKQLAS